MPVSYVPHGDSPGSTTFLWFQARRDQEPAGLAGIAQVRTTLLCLPETVPQSHQPASSARPLVWNLTAFCV